jgi:lysophospholipase L1-like esterase
METKMMTRQRSSKLADQLVGLYRRLNLTIVVGLIAFITGGLSAAETARIKVACIGDSITAGSGVVDRANDSYPAQLGKILGPNWEVRNYGGSGSTLLNSGDKR